MKKKIFLLLGLLSTTVFAQNNFLLFANNGLALNGIHSSDFAQDFAIKNRVNSNNQIKFNFEEFHSFQFHLTNCQLLIFLIHILHIELWIFYCF